MIRQEFSVVEYIPKGDGERCGYCKSLDSYFSCGMWAHSMHVDEYQSLLDRGWRRCGRYMYKPTMRLTCCPMYTIRCDVGALTISKSSKKVLKKFYNHLRFGDTSRDLTSGALSCNSSVEAETSTDDMQLHMEDVDIEPAVVDLDQIEMDTSPSKDGARGGIEIEPDVLDEIKNAVPDIPGRAVIPAPGEEEKGSEDVPAPPQRQRKAKLVRLENKYNKLRRRGMTEEEAVRWTYEPKKSSEEKKILEDYFPRPDEMSYFRHQFKIELHSLSYIEESELMLQETYQLYVKYQMAIHGDSQEELTMKQFKRFLLDSPLFDQHPTRPPPGFGSFHQQYRLDGRLIAVGVIDILPKCVSSVYYFYDPDLRSLSLGTYGSLQEIFFNRKLKKVYPSIEFYYLGYYIHNCPKMKYKGKYCPSYLLCPETFTWHRIEKCLPLLEQCKYSRLEMNPNVIDQHGAVNPVKVMILYKNRAMGYLKYQRIKSGPDEEEEVMEYAKLIGDDVYQNLLLYRS